MLMSMSPLPFLPPPFFGWLLSDLTAVMSMSPLPFLPPPARPGPLRV